MDSFGKITGILITVILIFIAPIYYFSLKQDMINQTYVTAATTYLIDSTRNIGYMSRDMYEIYLKKLNNTGNTYMINMTHYEFSLEYEEEYSKHYYTKYEEDILNQLYTEDKKYYFHQGDYLMIQVYNQNKTIASLLVESILQVNVPNEQVYVVYGGAIRDEAN